MSIETPNVIDICAVVKSRGCALLIITDHLEWGSREASHLAALTAKLNAYVGFIESGEIFESYPAARGRALVIRVLGKYPLTRDAAKFYSVAGEAVARAGCSLEFEDRSERTG